MGLPPPQASGLTAFPAALLPPAAPEDFVTTSSFEPLAPVTGLTGFLAVSALVLMDAAGKVGRFAAWSLCALAVAGPTGRLLESPPTPVDKPGTSGCLAAWSLPVLAVVGPAGRLLVSPPAPMDKPGAVGRFEIPPPTLLPPSVLLGRVTASVFLPVAAGGPVGRLPASSPTLPTPGALVGRGGLRLQGLTYSARGPCRGASFSRAPMAAGFSPTAADLRAPTAHPSRATLTCPRFACTFVDEPKLPSAPVGPAEAAPGAVRPFAAPVAGIGPPPCAVRAACGALPACAP